MLETMIFKSFCGTVSRTICSTFCTSVDSLCDGSDLRFAGVVDSENVIEGVECSKEIVRNSVFARGTSATHDFSRFRQGGFEFGFSE